MENEIIENKFELSVLGAFKIILVYNILIPCIVGVPIRLISLSISLNSPETLSLIIALSGDIITNIVSVKLLLNKIKRNFKVNFKVKYIEKFNFKLLLYTFLLVSGFFVCRQSSIGPLVEKIPLPKFIEEQFENLSLSITPSLIVTIIIIVISLIIIAPIFEEILMRGIILEGFLNKYKTPTAVIASSLIFGLLHLNIPQFINATLLGLLLGIIYYKTKSLILCIVAHALNNAMAISLIYVNLQFNIISFFIGIVILVISGILFIKYVNKLSSANVSFEKNSTSPELPIK